MEPVLSTSKARSSGQSLEKLHLREVSPPSQTAHSATDWGPGFQIHGPMGGAVFLI